MSLGKDVKKREPSEQWRDYKTTLIAAREIVLKVALKKGYEDIRRDWTNMRPAEMNPVGYRKAQGLPAFLA